MRREGTNRPGRQCGLWFGSTDRSPLLEGLHLRAWPHRTSSCLLLGLGIPPSDDFPRSARRLQQPKRWRAANEEAGLSCPDQHMRGARAVSSRTRR